MCGCITMASCVSLVDFVQERFCLAGARCIMWPRKEEGRSKNSARYLTACTTGWASLVMVSFHTKLETQH